MTTDATYDARKYKVCAPWHGQRGPAWTLVFKPSFENGLRTHKDKFATYYNFLVTQNDFGGANGPAHPGGAGASIHIESSCARANRVEDTYGLMLIHIENEDIRDGIRSHVANVLTGAPTVPAVLAAGAAITAANAANQAAIAAAAAAGAAPVLVPIPPAAVGAREAAATPTEARSSAARGDSARPGWSVCAQSHVAMSTPTGDWRAC